MVDQKIFKLPNSMRVALYFKSVHELESRSNHPLAHSLAIYLSSREIIDSKLKTPLDVAEFSESGGRGVIGIVEGFEFAVGNEKWMHENGYQLDNDSISILQNWKSLGWSLVLVGGSLQNSSEGNKRVIGAFAITDEIRAESVAVISALKAMGIQVWMISGDHEATALTVARAVGIPSENVVANVHPENKYEKVKELQELAKRENIGGVGMIGDGINDSVALAQAEVGIAIGAGSDVAIESADAVLVKSKLGDILNLIDLSKTVFNRIRLNFAWALGFNLVGIPIATGLFSYWGLNLEPAFAGLAMALSSVSVVTSSLLLNRYRPKV